MVTLLHFTHPIWLEDQGGFENDSSIAAFVKFSRRMYAEYGNKVSGVTIATAATQHHCQFMVRIILCGKILRVNDAVRFCGPVIK